MTDVNKLDDILSKAFREYVDEKIEEEFADVPVFNTTPSFDKKIKRAIKSEKNYYYKFTLTPARRILCACVIIIVLLLSLLSVGAVRETISGFYLEHFSDHDSLNVIYDINSTYPTKIETIYEPQYIPDGYTLVEEDISCVGATYVYNNGEDDLVVSQNIIQGGDINVDNENMSFYVEKIDGNEYYMSFSEEKGALVIWSDSEYLFDVSANLPKETVIEICKSLKIKN